MAEWDRFDICAAHLALENDWHEGGILWERPSNRRRNESTGCQLQRIQYRPGFGGGSFGALESDNEREIYVRALVAYGLAKLVRPDGEIAKWVTGYFVPEFLAEHFPQLRREA